MARPSARHQDQTRTCAKTLNKASAMSCVPSPHYIYLLASNILFFSHLPEKYYGQIVHFSFLNPDSWCKLGNTKMIRPNLASCQFLLLLFHHIWDKSSQPNQKFWQEGIRRCLRVHTYRLQVKSMVICHQAGEPFHISDNRQLGSARPNSAGGKKSNHAVCN